VPVVVSALTRKSITDLSRRRSRTFFAVATLALAVASIGIFALPSLMNRAMQSEVKAGRLADLTVYINPLELDGTELARLWSLPNVRAVEARSDFGTAVYVGERRAPAVVYGVRSFAAQDVNVVDVAAGAAPGENEVLSERQNANQGLVDAGTGDTLQVISESGLVLPLKVSGVGRNLAGGKQVTDDSKIVLYATPATVAMLSGVSGYDTLHFRVEDTSRAAVAATTEAVRLELRSVPGFHGFTWLPDVRAPGDWPGKHDFDAFTKFFYVITVLALLSALVLIANTMTTLIAEQTSEIGAMKAVGGRRRQIGLVYVKTAVLLGAVGALVGVSFGIVIANLLLRYMGSTFFAIDVGFGVDPVIVSISVGVGLLAPAIAALPAIRRAVRVPLCEALEATGSSVARQDAGDAVMRRVRFLPRTVQIGLRNVGRRRRRSLATAMMVALAVGNLLAILGLAAGVSRTTHGEWRDHGEDVKILVHGDTRAERVIRETPGVAVVEPMFVTEIRLAGKDGYIWAVRRSTMFHYRVVDGRWYTPAEERSRSRVAVLERNLARASGTHVGQSVKVETSNGPLVLRVVGIASNQQENGTAFFVPHTTMRAFFGVTPAGGDDYWVQMTSSAHPFVDRTTTRIQDAMAAAGYDVGTEIEYVEEANNVASNRTVTTTVAMLGFLIVAISMVGLANAITMSVIERTREIGILRTIGARARDVRRIFATESIAIALAGWLVGIPVGYLLERFLVWMVREIVNVQVPVLFPFANIGLALAGTVVLALMITLLPIRRAVRYRPGQALRYA
jgi:putative ABC transport system permease protein